MMIRSGLKSPYNNQLDHHTNNYDLNLIMVTLWAEDLEIKISHFHYIYKILRSCSTFNKLKQWQNLEWSVKYPRRTRPFKSGVCTCTENPDPVPRGKHRWAIQRSDPRLSKVALAFLMVAWRKRALGRDVQETKMKISEKWYIFCQKRWLLVFSGMELSVSPRQWTSKDAHWFWEISYPFFISLLTQEEEERLFWGEQH